jgi:hypothetical protein
VDIVEAVAGDEIGRLERGYWRKTHHAEASGQNQSDAKNGDLLLEIRLASARVRPYAENAVDISGRTNMGVTYDGSYVAARKSGRPPSQAVVARMRMDVSQMVVTLTFGDRLARGTTDG